MSEEKLYMVKNDDGEYWDFDFAGFWRRELPGYYAVTSKKRAEIVADERGGHVVTLIEEPEKVVLTKEQAEIVEEAHDSTYPARYITDETAVCDDDDEELLMNAYVNGYTVEKEKKYYVKVPHTKNLWYYESWNGNLHTTCQADKKLQVAFTEEDIEKYGLQDCEKEEVADDAE